MSFNPVNLRILLDVQLVTFYPKQVVEHQQEILIALNRVLKDCAIEGEFLVGATKLFIEEKP